MSPGHSPPFLCTAHISAQRAVWDKYEIPHHPSSNIPHSPSFIRSSLHQNSLHRQTRWSDPPDTKCLPSVVHARLRTRPSCPSRVSIRCKSRSTPNVAMRFSGNPRAAKTMPGSTEDQSNEHTWSDDVGVGTECDRGRDHEQKEHQCEVASLPLRMYTTEPCARNKTQTRTRMTENAHTSSSLNMQTRMHVHTSAHAHMHTWECTSSEFIILQVPMSYTDISLSARPPPLAT